MFRRGEIKKMRDLERVGEGSDNHRDPRADRDNNGRRQPRRKRENTVHDPVADIVANM